MAEHSPTEEDVMHHSDTELIRYWFRIQKPATRGGIFLWAKVRNTFTVGSTSAIEICRRHGADPDQAVLRNE